MRIRLFAGNMPHDLPLSGLCCLVEFARRTVIGVKRISDSSVLGVFSSRPSSKGSEGPSTGVIISGAEFEDVLCRPGIEDLRRIVLSTTSCSFDKLTIRVDIFLTIVPALANAEPASPGLKLRRVELDLHMSPDPLLPSSACTKSSPNRAMPEGLTFENLTLRLLLL